MLSAVIEEMQLVGDEILAGRLVHHDGIGLPAVPQPLDDGGELAGAVIAVGMRHVGVAAEIGGLGLVVGGHQVPAGAAAVDQVERGEFARQVIGLVVGGGRGRDEADLLGHGGQGGQQGQRLEIHRARGARLGVQFGRTDADQVGEEEQVEFAALGQLREFDAAAVVERAVGFGLRMRASRPRGGRPASRTRRA